MCGIAGIILKQAHNYELRSQMEVMLNIIAHRGPDGQGIFEPRPDFILGHRRLAILDLSSDGHQPMHSKDNQFTIIFNGEIYNYIEIKQQLIKKGYKFFTSTDTEVILNAYQCWGEDCVKYFNGMWAFAIFDKIKNIVFCSRDRFGVKPFYFITNDHYFVFCSEIKGLLPFIEQKVANLDIVLDYLLTGKSDHQSSGFFKNIQMLPASHFLIYDLTTQTFNSKRYYELKPLTEAISAQDYMNCLNDAVSLRLRSDVPVATCLSGGLDSSTVSALASSQYHQQFSAITAISEQASNDESSYAKMVVDHAKLNWITTKPNYQNFEEQIETIIYVQEEPFASPSIVMQYEVMKAARTANIPVLLDGQGGDETLLGYERYVASHAIEEYRKHGIKGFINGIRVSKNNNQKLNALKTAQYVFGTHFPHLRYRLHCLENAYLQNAFLKAPKHLKCYSDAAKSLFQLQKLEIESTNLPALLRFEDKNSMAHSIETRLPFLDYRAVEIALSLPFDVKIHQGWSKYLLRQEMKDKLPSEILWRKNKFGFEAPEQIWLSKHRNKMIQLIEHSKLLDELCQKKINPINLSPRTLWRLYTIALWEKKFQISGISA